MSERDAFLRAIIAQPDDDLPRLVYADWLDEHGEPERAEFIRVQVELATLPDAIRAVCSRLHQKPWPQCRRCDLLGHERELLEAHGQKWVPAGRFAWHNGGGRCTVHFPIDERTLSSTEAVFRRGFVESISCDWPAFARHADALVAATPLRRVVLTAQPTRQELFDYSIVVMDRSGQPLLAKSELFPGIEFELPPVQAADIVQTAVRELGRLRVSDVLTVDDYPALARLLARDRVSLVSHATDCLHFRAVFEVTERELTLDRSARRIVDLIADRRRTALEELLRRMEDAFAAGHPGADPDEWRTVIPCGGWLRETVVPDRTRRSTVTFIDARLCWERVPVAQV